MKKNSLFNILLVTLLVLFLRMINIFQIENGFGKPIVLIFMIILFSFLSIKIQKKIDLNYQEKSLNYDNLDILKYMCAIIIVVCHLRPFLGYSYELDLIFNNMISRITVPVFFMITGYFIGKKLDKQDGYIPKYIKSSIPLYLVWSFLYIPVYFLTIQDYLPMIEKYIAYIDFPLPLLILAIPIFLLIGLLYTGTYYHLWYFPALLTSLYVIDKWKKKYSLNILTIIAFILLLFGATETYYGALPITLKQWVDYYFQFFFTTRNFLFFGLFYILLGIYMGQRQELYSKNCFIKLVVCFFSLIFEAIVLQTIDRLDSNILLSAIGLTYYLFICSVYLTKKNTKLTFPFRDLSKYYFFVHPMMIAFCFYVFKIITPQTNPFIQVFYVLLTTHLVSKLIIYIKKKYPKLIL